MDRSDGFLTTAEVAALRGVTYQSIIRERARVPYSGPPFVRVAGIPRYPIPELERWLTERGFRPAAK